MRIGIVNDVPLAAEAIRHAVALRPHLKVIWVASDGAQAVQFCRNDRPDLVLMDLIMPVMDGVEATRQIMAQNPCAILVVTASVGANVSKVFDAMGHGALDAVDTPPLAGAARNSQTVAFLDKIDRISVLIHNGAGMHRSLRTTGTAASDKRHQLVAIGASAGGPAALAELLQALPRDFSPPVLIVQHVDEMFAQGLADWLARHSSLPVRLAREGDHPTPGTVLVAGTSNHLVFHGPNTLGYSAHPLECAYRPSIDAFFSSILRHWRGRVVGVLLTGMGRDGAAGLRGLRDAGHHTIAQDKATSSVYGMPKAAADLQAAVEILPLSRIAAAVAQVFHF